MRFSSRSAKIVLVTDHSLDCGFPTLKPLLNLKKRCHPEPAVRRSAGEGPYEACEEAWKSTGWPTMPVAAPSLRMFLTTSAMVEAHRKLPLSSACGIRVRDGT